MFFSRTYADGVALEVRRGFANDGYASAKIELGRLPKKELDRVLGRLDQIASRVERRR